MANQPNSSGHVVDDLKQYINLKLEYYRLDSIEKGSLFLGNFLMVLVCMILACFALLCLSFAVAYWVGDLLGSSAWGFVLTTMVYVVLIAVIVKFKETILINPMIRLLDTTLFKTDEHDGQDNL